MSSKIGHLPLISAVYYALLQSGYEFYSLGRDEDFSGTVRSFAGEEPSTDFFRNARKDDGRVYPYWPGAFILEAASFHLNDDLNGFRDLFRLKDRIQRAENIGPEDKGEELWDWLDGFPQAIKEVACSDGFRRYLDWEAEWIAEQNESFSKDLNLLDSLMEGCRERYVTGYDDIRIVLCAVKCTYASDYHSDGRTLIFTSGEMRPDSVIHEYMHSVVHPLIDPSLIRDERRRWPGIDKSYYLDGTEKGRLNAFEEHAVRALTEKIMKREMIADIAEELRKLAGI